MEPRAAAGKHGSGRELRAGGTTSMMCSRCHRVIGELVVANRELHDVIAMYQSLEEHLSGRLYESLAAAAGLPPDLRHFEPDDGPSVDAVLARAYLGDQEAGDG